MRTIVCKKCSTSFDYNARGRAPSLCRKCKGETDTGSPQVSHKANILDDVIQSLEKEENAENVAPVRSVDPLGTFTYEVVVSNLGYAYRGEDIEEAKKAYTRYQGMSERGFGQCGRERVSLYEKAEIVWQFNPSTDMV